MDPVDPSIHPTLAATLAGNAFGQAVVHLVADHARIIEDTIRLQQIPAPCGGEAVKAAALAADFAALGLQDVEVDAAGNAIGRRPGQRSERGLVAIVSHLDTVFPADTPLAVRREGSRLIGPGISDNTRGAALLLGLLRALAMAGVTHSRDILVVGSVGEEGLGDLRGVKHLLGAGRWSHRIELFIALDGSRPQRVVNGALGSRRYDVVFSGPGGHSYAAFGTVNPVYAMARAMLALARLPVGQGTTHNVGVVEGGVSINAIPTKVRMQVDLRSPDPHQLADLEQRFLAAVQAAVVEENAANRTGRGKIAAEPRLVGDRPSGRTPADSPLVLIALSAIAAHGWQPVLETASTDASIAIAKGLPAIGVASGIGDKAHSLDEYLETDPALNARQMGMALATLLAAAEL